MLLDAIREQIEKHPDDIAIYEDYFSALQNEGKRGYWLRAKALAGMRLGNPREFWGLYKRVVRYDARDDLDSYLQYLEIDRKPNERFYLPRRDTLKPLVDALQDLTDDKLDELFISMPPRTGKTTLLMFYMTWLIGKNSEAANLYSAYSDVITKAFYNGVLEILQDKYTYLWSDVFPDSRIVATNAADETVNIDRKKRYPSLTCRSLYGTLNGACDCNGVLMSDDLIGSIEEALSRDRLISAWSKVDNNLIPRAKEKAKLLWCGTRWSMIDPAGLRMDLLLHDDKFAKRRYRIINLPALNENDESNFKYKYGVGFSSEFYQQRRASFERNNDMASWFAQYQGEPIERQGALFVPDEMRYFTDYPDGERVFMSVDPAFGGGDFVAAPVCLQSGEDIYVIDVVYDNSDKRVTQALIADLVEKYDVTSIQVEANKSVESYAEEVTALLKKKGLKVGVTTKPAPNNARKESRILDFAPEIRENMLFKSGNRSKHYELFMQNVFSFKINGRNKHDDAPDSLAMAIDMTRRKTREVKIFKRPF